MKVLSFSCLVFFISVIFPSFTLAVDFASGSIVVDDDKTEIKHVYTSEFDGDITIILASSEIPESKIPEGVYDYGAEGKFRGIVFVISDETKKLQSGGLYGLINAIHYHPKLNKLGTIGNGELKNNKFDNDIFSAKIVTPSENSVEGHKFSYNISFSVNLKKVPVELTFSDGNTDPPSLAYQQWAKAMFTGDTVKYREYCSSEVLEMLPDDHSELKEGMEFQKMLFPTTIVIIDNKTDGNKSTLTMMGKNGEEVSEGKAIMLRENGKWKVNEQTWESSL